MNIPKKDPGIRIPRSTITPVDFAELISNFSIPRPNGSEGARITVAAIKSWLDERGIPYRLHPYTQYPFFFECIGLWLIFSRGLLALSVWLRWGWAVLPISLIGLSGGLLDYAFHIPLVTWPGRRQAQNFLIEFEPPTPRQEVILSAHYDSKTEPLDHRQRMFLLYSIPFGLILSLILAVLGPLDALAFARQAAWEHRLYELSISLSLLLLILAWILGLNLCLGRLLKPSQGSVDNGAACAILLGLAERLARGEFTMQNTRLTIALFSGEEINLQGSRAYAKGGDWSLPVRALNLEAMAQDGDYVYWEHDGSIFGLQPTSPELNEIVVCAVTKVAGKTPRPSGPVVSDGASFMAVGVPASTLGTLDSRLGDTGFHRPTDNPERILPSRLPEGVEILLEVMNRYDIGWTGSKE
jgi:Peptidase family M28